MARFILLNRGGRQIKTSGLAALMAALALNSVAARCQPPSAPAPPGRQRGLFENGPLAPPLNRKLQEIVALRVLAAMRFTAADIDAALPLLRELRTAEQELQAHTEQIIEEERSALLSARPSDPLPPDSGDRIQQELARFRERQERSWADLAKRLKPEKAEELKRIISGPRPPGDLEAAGNDGPPRPPEPGKKPKKPGEGEKKPGRGAGLEPRLRLPELIALLEQKRAALSR